MKVWIIVLFCLNTICGLSQQIDYSKFKGSSIDVSLKISLADASFFEYSSNKGDYDFSIISVTSKWPLTSCESIVNTYYRANTKSEIISLHNNSLPKNYNGFFYDKNDTLKNYLGLVHKLTFNYGGLQTSVIKYFEFKDSSRVEYNTVLLQNKDDRWRLAEIKELNDVVYVVKVLSTNSFWEFYNKSASKYKTINELRKQVKDEDGIVDIKKLARVIKDNKSRLTEFCNFN